MQNVYVINMKVFLQNEIQMNIYIESKHTNLICHYFFPNLIVYFLISTFMRLN